MSRIEVKRCDPCILRGRDSRAVVERLVGQQLEVLIDLTESAAPRYVCALPDGFDRRLTDGFQYPVNDIMLYASEVAVQEMVVVAAPRRRR